MQNRLDGPASTLPNHTLSSARRFAGRRAWTVTQDVNVLALVKGSERYIFLYDDNNRSGTLRMLGRYASNPDLSFTWYDAAVLSQKVRQNNPPSAGIGPRFNLPEASDQLDPDETV